MEDDVERDGDEDGKAQSQPASGAEVGEERVAVDRVGGRARVGQLVDQPTHAEEGGKRDDERGHARNGDERAFDRSDRATDQQRGHDRAVTSSADGATLYAAALDRDTARTDAGTTWIAR